jgi:hypothetical protein
MACHGCVKTTWCRYAIPGCAARKGVSNCGICKSYSSCKRLNEMFVRNQSFDVNCRSKCSEEEYEMLRRVCFDKKENLDNARIRNHKK